MRAFLTGLLATTFFAGIAAACGGASAGNGIQVKLVTPANQTATPTLEPGATPTALVAPELVLSTIEVYQAGAVLVSVTGDISGGTAKFLGRDYKLAKGAQSMFAFVAVDAEDPVGPAPLKVDVTLKNGSKASLQDTLHVVKTDWTVDSLEFTDDKDALLDPKTAGDELAFITAIYKGVTPDKLWDGPWLMPVNGAITARYGEQRSINGSAPSGHHGGTDLGAEEGTQVLATNAGRVVLAKEMKVRGNMVIIDHGGGLYSAYCHLSVIHVAEGQVVEAGEHIADSGNTGLSTGAHLHWEMASQGVFLDALRFTDGTNGF
jgi:murein DD-endopeptidase MepM/ murein hydrolase activator NlpD